MWCHQIRMQASLLLPHSQGAATFSGWLTQCRVTIPVLAASPPPPSSSTLFPLRLLTGCCLSECLHPLIPHLLACFSPPPPSPSSHCSRLLLEEVATTEMPIPCKVSNGCCHYHHLLLEPALEEMSTPCPSPGECRMRQWQHSLRQGRWDEEIGEEKSGPDKRGVRRCRARLGSSLGAMGVGDEG